MLLVICRPGRGDAVPFRSVAGRLVRGGAERMEGLDLDVLRPATFARLGQVLREAAAAGLPYNVVHFDGHGAFLDVTTLARPGPAGGGSGVPLSPLRYGVSVAGPVRGRHGYLLFEDPAIDTNQQLVDGPTLGRLLTDAQVPVLVLNACRSAYAETSSRPEGTGQERRPGAGQTPATAGDAVLEEDVHGRIRAYGSLAAEVADLGVPGVVAMRYNVYVATAAQFVADLYAHLLAGRSLGEAATEARRSLAAAPTRQISAAPVSLQDWIVPVVYEAAPLTLFTPATRAVPRIELTSADAAGGAGASPGGLPRPPDAGFFGRDETLLALDRTFDTQRVVLLHAYAGAGKSSTAAEFARWYRATGGLDDPAHPGFPGWGAGPVIWSSFEHYLPLDRLLDAVGDTFAQVLEANGIHWQAVTDAGQRRDLVLQVLAQVNAAWVWDNVEPVTGFPVGTPSAWTSAEQDELADFLRDLAQRTRCKVLLTSRRDEPAWLGGLPARVKLPPMPMRERLQLAHAIAARHSHPVSQADWRPLLRYTAGNPLTITVLVGLALREHLTTTDEMEKFVARLRVGEAALEPGEDEALGPLAASLGYGFASAFTGPERDMLALLHLFRDTVDVNALRAMGNPEFAGDDAVPQLSGLTRETGIALLGRAAEIGLLAPVDGGYYTIHPALPWYLTSPFAGAYGPADAARASRAYTRALADLGYYYWQEDAEGRSERAVAALALEEANLQHALALARSGQRWDDAVDCLQGLNILYSRTGRAGERARLVAEVTPDYIDSATDGPLPGREDQWGTITSYRVRLARDARDWPTATRLQQAAVAWERDRAATALAIPNSQLTPADRDQLRPLAVVIEHLGHILFEQGDPGCLPRYEEALGLYQRIGARPEEARLAHSLGNAYLKVPTLRDVDKAEHSYQHSLDLRADHDRLGRAKSFGSLGIVAYERFLDAEAVDAPEPVLVEHLNAALRSHRQALDMTPADALDDLAVIHHRLGVIYGEAGETAEALRHYQQSIWCCETQGSFYNAGITRFNIARLLDDVGRPADALHYARAALDNFERVGPGAAEDVADARRLIADLEQQGR